MADDGAEFMLLCGPDFVPLANDVSNAIVKAINGGMDPDEAVICALQVACDYGRTFYGDAYLDDLAEIVRRQSEREVPAPEVAPNG